MKRLLAIAALVLHAAPSHAANDTGPVSVACAVKGKAALPEKLFASASGGTHLLTLSTHERTIEVTELPTDTATGRLRIRAVRDVPGIRVDGYVAAKAVTFSATTVQTVISDHVWIRAGASLRLFQSATDLQAEPIGSPIAHVRAQVACGELRLGTFGSAVLPKTNDWYYFKANKTPLLDGPGGKPVFSIELLVDRTSVSVGSLKKQGVYQQIELSDVVRVVGWVRAADLEPVNDGGSAHGLGLLGTSGYGSSQTVRTAKLDSEIYLGPGTTGPMVGVLEKGARVYASAVANGYSTITFVDRDALPPDGKQFHVLTSSVM